MRHALSAEATSTRRIRSGAAVALSSLLAWGAVACGGSVEGDVSGQGGATSSGGGGGEAAGGASGAAGAGGVLAGLPFDPRDDFPDRLGTVTDMEAQPTDGCCTRQADAPVMAACPPGADVSVAGTFEKVGDRVALGDTLNTQGAAFEVTALSLPGGAPATVVLTETAVPTPSGVVDVSPAFHVAGVDGAPPMAAKVPVSTASDQYHSQTMALVFSEDGSAFATLADSYVNAGFLEGTMPGAGFVMAVVALPEGSCQ